MISYLASNNAVGTGSTITLTKPTGTLDGDLMIAIFTSNNAAIVNTLAGWTLMASVSVGALSFTTFYKKALSEGASYAFTIGNTAGGSTSGAIATYRGIKIGVDVNATSISVDTTTPMTISSVTTGHSGLLLILAGANLALGGKALSTPSGFTNRFDVNPQANSEVFLADQPNNPVGATGAVSVTFSGGLLTPRAFGMLVQLYELGTSGSLFFGTNI